MVRQIESEDLNMFHRQPSCRVVSYVSLAQSYVTGRALQFSSLPPRLGHQIVANAPLSIWTYKTAIAKTKKDEAKRDAEAV